jgi:hypothetical protein
MSNYEFGKSKTDLIGDTPQYFYGIKRNDDGEIIFTRVNLLSRESSITVNVVGDAAENFTEFETGVDYSDGRDAEHNIVFDNLSYEQYRWNNASMYYYIDADGQLVARMNTKYPYPNNIGS